jgi:hypothetical protein
MKCFEDIGANNLDTDNIINNYENLGMEIDLVPLVMSFPYNITNDRLKKELDI